jgi:hypothetical protein
VSPVIANAALLISGAGSFIFLTVAPASSKYLNSSFIALMVPSSPQGLVNSRS